MSRQSDALLYQDRVPLLPKPRRIIKLYKDNILQRNQKLPLKNLCHGDTKKKKKKKEREKKFFISIFFFL
jgi:hypothetical protein